MRGKELREWLFTHGAEDRWWVYLDGQMLDEPYGLDAVHELQIQNRTSRIRVLHISMASMDSPPWVEYETVDVPESMRDQPPVDPRRPASKRPQPPRRSSDGRRPGSSQGSPASGNLHQRPRRRKALSSEALMGIIALGALVVVVVLIVVTSGSGEDAAAAKQASLSQEAYDQTSEYVRSLFDEQEVEVWQVAHAPMGGNRFKVIGEVKLGQGSNQKPPFQYWAVAEWDPGKNRWRVQYLQINDPEHKKKRGTPPANFNEEIRQLIDQQ